MRKCFLWTILTQRWMPFAQNIWGIVSSIISINFLLYDTAKTHKWEKGVNLTSKWRVGGNHLAVPVLFTELLAGQMGTYTVSFRCLTRVWFRVKSPSSLCSQQNQLSGDTVPGSEIGVCSKQQTRLPTPVDSVLGAGRRSLDKLWIPQRGLYTVNSIPKPASYIALVCSDSRLY